MLEVRMRWVLVVGVWWWMSLMLPVCRSRVEHGLLYEFENSA